MEKRIIEDERTEFKAIINDKLEKVVIAFLNSKCYYIIFPVYFTSISETEQENVQVNEQENVQVSEQENVQVSKQENVQVSKQGNVQVSKQESVQVSKQENVQVTEQENVQVSEQESVQVTEQESVQVTEQENVQVSKQENVQVSKQESVQVSKQESKLVKKLIQSLQANTLSISDIMNLMGLKNRPSFSKNYIKPALELGLVEQTQPESLKSPTQKYRLTNKGKILLVNYLSSYK